MQAMPRSALIRPLLSLVLLIGLAALSLPAAAETPEVTPADTRDETPPPVPALLTLDDVRSGQLMLRADEPGRYVAAPLVSTKIDIAVTGPILRATVTQRFRNPSEAWVEGVYAFPLPEDSAVDTLRMRIGDRFIEGRIEERQEAKRIYEEAKAEGKKAALVEQERPNLFTNSVANIGPHEVIVTQITFQQALAPRDGRWELRMPLVAAPRYNPAPVVQQVDFGEDGWAISDPVPDRERVESPVADPARETPGTIRNPVALAVDLAPGFALGSVESLAHEVSVEAPGPDRRLVMLTGPVPADRDFVLRWTADFAEPKAALFRDDPAAAPGDERAKPSEEHLLLTLAPPALGPAAPVRAREVIFVQDVSGSMSGGSIEQARAGLEAGLERLRAQDRFNLIVFNDGFAVFADAPLPATPENIRRAVGAVRALEADGGTEMYPALDYALTDAAPEDERLRQVIFLTDGAVGNEAEMLALIDRKLGRSRLFTVGIGSAPNSYFMTRAAETGRGAHVYIGDLSEVGARMEALFAKIEAPAITDLALTLPEGVSGEIYPTPLPDLYAGAPLTLAMRLDRATGTARLTGQRAGQPWRLEVPLAQAVPRPGVAKLWARQKIASLEAFRLSPGLEPDQWERVDAEILATALDAGLVSRLTSLVAVDVTPSRPADQTVESREIALTLPAGWDPEAFLFENADPAPSLDKAMLQRLAPAADPNGPAADAAPLPKGALNWWPALMLGLGCLAAGLLLLLVTLRRRPAGPA